MAKKELVEKKDLHEYEVTLEASYYCTEEATISLMASNQTEAEEMAIEETRDGQHFGNGEFEGYNGWDSDVDLETVNVERTDGEEEEEEDDF
jgi:hypothetical protein